MTVVRGNLFNRVSSRVVALATVAGLVVAAGHVQAQPPRSHRDAAIALGEEGLQLLDRGNHEAALRKFEAANDLVPAPTFGIRAALCLEHLGRLVEALDRYDQVATMPVDPSWPEVHAQAQQRARQRAVDLRGRVARLYVQLQGGVPDQAAIEIDGRDLTYQDLASAQLLDPGRHTIEVTYQGRVQRRDFTVKEGARHQEKFQLERGASRPEPEASAQGKAGWLAVGTGATGLAVGAVAGLVAWNKSQDLESRCPDRTCPPEAWDDNDSYYRWRNVSSTGFAVGAITLGAGTILLLTDSKAPAPDRTGCKRIWIGVGSAGFGGHF